MVTKRKKRLRILMGSFLFITGAAIIIPPPEVEIILISGLLIAGVPLATSIFLVYLIGALLFIIGSFLIGKRVRESILSKKLNKKEVKDEKESKIGKEKNKA